MSVIEYESDPIPRVNLYNRKIYKLRDIIIGVGGDAHSSDIV